MTSATIQPDVTICIKCDGLNALCHLKKQKSTQILITTFTTLLIIRSDFIFNINFSYYYRYSTFKSMFKPLVIVTFILVSMSSCSKRTSDPSALPEDKHASELTYMDIYNIALAAENGGGMDFHGDPFGSEAIDDLSIYANGGCGKDDCGYLLGHGKQKTQRNRWLP